MDGSPTPGVSSLLAELAQHKAGEAVQLEVVHCSGAYGDYTVTLAPSSRVGQETLEEEAVQRAARQQQEKKARLAHEEEERQSEANQTQAEHETKLAEEGKLAQEG
jgi:hypothetical protein